MKDLHLKTAVQIAELVNNKTITALEVTEYFLKRAYELNPKMNAFISITNDLAIEQAKLVDERIGKGDNLPLAGVPVGIKDNLNVIGTQATCASKILENYKCTFEATATKKLWDAGAICIGKTNLDEFAMGSSTDYSAFGASHNPYNLKKAPGGSSGGSAVAVSARLVSLSLGSDTGGSIRQPASLCGIVGMKPTYGYISRYGLIAFASSLDQIGPFATNVEDASLALSIMLGHDPMDSTSLYKINYDHGKIKSELNWSEMTVGIIKEFQENNSISPDVRNTNEKLITELKNKGVRFKEISMPIATEMALDCYYIVAPAEASSNLARFDGVRYGYREKNADNLLELYKKSRANGFGEEVKRRIMIGTYVLSAGYYDAYYKKAQQVRHLITKEFQAAFDEVDVLLMPTSPVTAFDLGSKTNDPLSMYLCDILTIPANLVGVPGISINAGYDHDGLPIGMQLLSNVDNDQVLMQYSYQIENLINSYLEYKLPVNI